MTTKLLERGWEGFCTDVARDQLPQGLAYRMKDYIPQLESPTRKRGGWSYASTDLNGINSTSYMTSAGWYQRPDITTDDHLIVVGSNGKVYKITTYSSAGGAYVGQMSSTVVQKHNPIYTLYGDLLIFPGERTSGKLVYRYYWSGAAYTLAALAAGAEYTLGTSWGDATVFSGKYSSPKTVYFSIASDYSIGASQTWDMPGPVVGLAALPNVVIVFGNEDTWGLVGSQIPPGGDMSQRTLVGGVGCMDPRSIVQSNSWVIWASQSGVYKTDGTATIDLTDNNQEGIRNYWRTLVSGFKLNDNWIAAGGLYHNEYWISVHNDTGTLKGTLIYDLERGKWREFTNVGASCYAHRPGSAGTSTASGEEELFFGRRSNARVGYLSSCYSPSSSNPSDADGTAVLPVIETGFYRFDRSEPKRLRRVFVNYDLRASSGSPTLEVGFIDTPESTSYEISSDALVATTRATRTAAGVRRKLLGAAFRLRQTAASDDTRVSMFEGDGYAMEEFRR